MNIRSAEFRDLARIMEIYEGARGFMRRSGNPNQWTGGYPSEATVSADIASNDLYVLEEDGQLHAVYYFRIGDDPTYGRIDGGRWIKDGPYGVIHRVAVSTPGRGLISLIFDHCFSIISNIRIDTHRDNLPMQTALAKNGFILCGIIYLQSGDERLAYQKIGE